MSSLLQEIAAKAHSLSIEECAALAHELIAGLDHVADSGIETAWDAEIERRVREIKSGKAKGISVEDILAEIRARYS